MEITVIDVHTIDGIAGDEQDDDEEPPVLSETRAWQRLNKLLTNKLEFISLSLWGHRHEQWRRAQGGLSNREEAGELLQGMLKDLPAWLNVRSIQFTCCERAFVTYSSNYPSTYVPASQEGLG